jgi:hypothetical protein
MDAHGNALLLAVALLPVAGAPAEDDAGMGEALPHLPERSAAAPKDLSPAAPPESHRPHGESHAPSETDLKAIDYAAATGVDMPEARRRASLMDEVRAARMAIRAAAENTFAGIWLGHEP